MGKLIALYDSSRRSAGVPNTENRRCDSQFMEFNTLCLILSIAAVVLCAVFFAAGVLYRKKVAEKQIGSAEEEARRIINEAIKGGESKKREMLLEAKEEIHKSRSEYEQEVKERRAEVSKQERRLQQKEEALDKKVNLHEKKEDELAKKIAADGEGADRLMTCTVTHAADEQSAETLAMSICSSSLVKAAMFGADANWGRIVCAMGQSGVKFDPYRVDIEIASVAGHLEIVKHGVTTDYDEKEASHILSEKQIKLKAHMNMGDEMATAWGCDLTYDYIKINADYRK